MSSSSSSSSSSSLPREFLSKLPMEKMWNIIDLYKWEGFWYRSFQLEGVIATQTSFISQDDDVILASPTKADNTWLKALIPCIMMMSTTYSDDEQAADILFENHPNDLMPSLEFEIFGPNSQPTLPEMSSPRLFRTHIPYNSLPESVKNQDSKCKIVYIARDPKDVFVSLWYFKNTILKLKSNPFPIEKAFEEFCKGIHSFGPFHDHVLGYWKESQLRSDKILFLKYEDMKKNPVEEVTKLASFLGKPFKFKGKEEAEKILGSCSHDRLKKLHQVNYKEESLIDNWISRVPKHAYFRKGVVGDWKNHLSFEMKERLDEITRNKFHGSGLNLLSD